MPTLGRVLRQDEQDITSGTSEGDFIHPTIFTVALSGSGIRLGTETRADVGVDPVLLEDSGGGRDGVIHR